MKRWLWLVSGLFAAAPTTAAAQAGYVALVGGSYGCVVGAECAADSECDPGEVCEGLGGASRSCVPHDALLCGSEEDGLELVCPTGSRSWSASPLGLSVTVCVPSAVPEECLAESCFFAPASPGEPVAFELGDCDRDGLPNGDDPAPCRAAPAIGLVNPTDGSCDPLVTRTCVTDADCGPERSLCREVSTTEAHKYCVANDPPILCCGGFGGTECANGAACMPDVPDGVALCFPYCSDWELLDRLDCVRDPEDPTMTFRPGAGDCDGDGVVNGEEARTDGRDPCVAEDGGLPPPNDGGSQRDAGSNGARDGAIAPMDAAGSPTQPIEPRFTGGGCRCRASAPGGGGAPWWATLAGLALLRRRRGTSARGASHSG